MEKLLNQRDHDSIMVSLHWKQNMPKLLNTISTIFAMIAAGWLVYGIYLMFNSASIHVENDPIFVHSVIHAIIGNMVFTVLSIIFLIAGEAVHSYLLNRESK